MKFAMKNAAIAVCAASALLLSACGTNQGDRAVSGGLLGAGAGAAIGSLYGDAGKGAVIGGLAGAAAGALTDPCSVNLGDPFWRDQNASRDDYERRCGYYPPEPPPPRVSWQYYGDQSQGRVGPPQVPPGHLPRPGQCRIWYQNRPPGRQPAPGPCNQLRNRVPPGAYLLVG